MKQNNAHPQSVPYLRNKSRAYKCLIVYRQNWSVYYTYIHKVAPVGNTICSRVKVFELNNAH